MPATSIRSGFKTFVIAGVLGFPLIGTGCATLNPTGQGAAVGAGVGAAAGAVIGNQTGSTSRGAILGAVIGGTAGALIGRRMDDTAEEIQADVPGASVERVGEGILVVFDSGILFDFDSSTLRPAARENLRRLAENLRDDADTELLVVGHTDDVGNDDYNQRLSERRAAAASDYLMENGVRPSRVRTSGRGEMEPVQSNASEAGRQANRRVEIAIFASDEYRSRVGR